jgi:hypothetical protein
MGRAAGLNMLFGIVRTKFDAVLVGKSGIGFFSSFTVVQVMISAVAGFGMKSSAVRDEFLATADYLVLAVCIFLAIASQQSVLGFNINSPLFRTVVGIVALWSIASHDQVVQKAVICCCVLVLLVVSVVGLMT